MYASGLLAGLDSELGSVSHEFLGSTAAESVLAYWSWFFRSSFGNNWEGAQCAGFSVCGEGGFNIVVGLDLGGSYFSSGVLVLESLQGVLGLGEADAFALRNGSREFGSGGGNGGSVSGNGGAVLGDLAINKILRGFGGISESLVEVKLGGGSGDCLCSHGLKSGKISQVNISSGLGGNLYCFLIILDLLKIGLHDYVIG